MLLERGFPNFVPRGQVGAFPMDDNADPRRLETVDEARASETVQDCST